MFDPFYTTKEVDKGTGMGLAIVLGIVLGHGGMITVDSEPGEDTTFNMFFPIVKTEKIQRTEVPGELSQGNERILFVDDEKMVAEMGCTMLERQGYKVTGKTSSIDALKTFKSDPEAFDLVITDQTMPNMSGAELAVELLKIRPGIPIILCTGYSKKISEKEAKELGIREFLLKPFDRRQLAKSVRKVLDKNDAP
jgi:CheY-like chemotaxis protein